MLSREPNAYLTQTNAGTPMGALLRRFSFPALLSSELPHPDSEPLRVRYMGEDLVAFRDTNGQVGLIQNNCPHRQKVKAIAYPAVERSGVVWAYMGPSTSSHRYPTWSGHACPGSSLRHQTASGQQLPAGDCGRHRLQPCVVPAG
jgi:hypothetical protein